MQIFAVLATATSLILQAEVTQAACGGYYEKLASGRSFTITSPNYPNNYPIYKKCAWLFYANDKVGFEITIGTVSGQGTGDNCKDYVEFREYTSTGTLLVKLCDNTSPRTIKTNSPILWVKFQSDHQFVNKGFTAEITTINVPFNNYMNYTNTTKPCHLTEYTCPNKECVFTGNLCDGVNDCGCDDANCDESNCWKFALLESVAFNWGVGVSIGFVISMLMLIIFGLTEMREERKPNCLKTSHNAEGCCSCMQRWKKNKVNMGKKDDMAVQKIIASLNQGRHPLRWTSESTESPEKKSQDKFKWDSSSESDMSKSNSSSRRTSTIGSPGASRRSSAYQAPNYGNTLSVPRPKEVRSGKSTPTTPTTPTSGTTLAVPKLSYA